MFWFALDVGAYDKKTSHLTFVEHGAYFALMRTYYSTRKPLPSDEGKLQRICRAHSDEEFAAISRVLSEFFYLKNSEYHNVRCDEELSRLRKLSKKYALRAKLAASKRWSTSNATSIPQAVLEEPDLQLHIHTHKNKIKSKSVRAHFSIPSLGEVTAYCNERNRGVDPRQWFNHYTANGWKVGQNAMKDWRAAVRTWEKNGYERTNSNQQPTQQTRQPSAQVARYHNNRAEVERTFGAAASLGGFTDSNSAGQEARLGAGDPRVLETEIKRLP